MAKMNKTKKIFLTIFLIIGVALILHQTGLLGVLLKLFGSPEYLKQVLEPFGVYAAFILIVLLLTNNILWVIPGHGLGVACGLIFGVFWGTVVCMIGTTLSTIVAVAISKKWGRPAAKSILGKKKFDKYEHMASSKDVWPFVLFVLVPVIPDDATAYLAGLTNLNSGKLIIALALARFPGALTLIIFGDGVANTNYSTIGATALVIALVSAVSIWKRQKIMDFTRRETGE